MVRSAGRVFYFFCETRRVGEGNDEDEGSIRLGLRVRF
jgi:hypothetical protein